MTYKTINLNPETYERLILYKHGNMTFDDVINKVLNNVNEEEFYEYILKEHKKRIKKIRAGDCVETNDLDEALKDV